MSVCIYAGMYTHTCTSAWMVCISRIMSPASFLRNISPKPKIDTNCQTQSTEFLIGLGVSFKFKA